MSQLDSRRVYSGRVISLDVDTVGFPNGVIGELEMIRHPGASAVVPLMGGPAASDTRILLIRQYRYASGGYLYEIPAGRLDEGETPETCARRELQEETGYSATSLTLLTSFFTTPGFTDELIHVFLATGLARGTATPEPDEILETHEVALSTAVAMVAGGEIVDGKSIVGILLASARLSG